MHHHIARHQRMMANHVHRMAHALFHIIKPRKPAIQINPRMAQRFNAVGRNSTRLRRIQHRLRRQPTHAAVKMRDHHNLFHAQFQHRHQQRTHHRTPRMRYHCPRVANHLHIAVFHAQRRINQLHNPRVHARQNRQLALGVFVGLIRRILLSIHKRGVVRQNFIQFRHCFFPQTKKHKTRIMQPFRQPENHTRESKTIFAKSLLPYFLPFRLPPSPRFRLPCAKHPFHFKQKAV